MLHSALPMLNGASNPASRLPRPLLMACIYSPDDASCGQVTAGPSPTDGQLDAILQPYTISSANQQGKKNNFQATEMKIFPDSGASICLAGYQHLSQMGLTTSKLIPCEKSSQLWVALLSRVTDSCPLNSQWPVSQPDSPYTSVIQWTKIISVDVAVLMLASCLLTSHYPHTSPQVVCHLSARRISNNLVMLHLLRDHHSQSLIPNPVHDHSHNALLRSLTHHHRTTSLNWKNTSSTPSVSQRSIARPLSPTCLVLQPI